MAKKYVKVCQGWAIAQNNGTLTKKQKALWERFSRICFLSSQGQACRFNFVRRSLISEQSQAAVKQIANGIAADLGELCAAAGGNDIIESSGR
jgi:hypothetical protein